MKLKFTLLVNLLCCVFFAHAQTNVALNKQVVVSTGDGDAIVNGDVGGARWESVHGPGIQWAYVDLGAVYNISQIKIVWEGAGAKNYQIQVSNDINNWGTAVQDITNNATLVNDYTGLAVSGRYVRIYCTERMLPYGYSIFELEVYSTTVPSNLAPKVKFTAPGGGATHTYTSSSPGTIPFTVSATDADGTVSKVEFFNGNTKLGEDTSSPYNYTWTDLPTGNYVVTAVATDNTGNVAYSQALNIVVELPIVIPQCGGIGMDSDYSYKFSWDAANPTITFIPNPNRPTTGATTLILYYNTTGADPLPGYNIQPNVPFTLNVANGETAYFYFTYSYPAGGEKNNAAARHQFVVGSCNSTINLARSQPITASTVNGVELAKNANDNNNGTRWQAANVNNRNDIQWIYVDLGDVYDLTGVNILWEGAKAEEYTIQATNNPNGTWSDLLTITGNLTATAAQRNHTVTGTGRYLRIYCTKKTAEFPQYGYSIYEIQAFGMPHTGPLPVSLIGFESKLANNGSVNLTWATSSEQNNSYFLLERSADGKTFGLLNKVSSKGSNSQSRLDYQYTDRTPLAGANYYRLTQFDLNGDHQIVGHTTQNVSLTVQSLTLSPNPLVGTELTINVSNTKAATAKVTISSITGAIIYSQTLNVAAGLAKANLNTKPAAGIYLVKVADLPTQKLIIK